MVERPQATGVTKSRAVGPISYLGSGMTLQESTVGRGGVVAQSQARPGGATLAPLKSSSEAQQECPALRKQPTQQVLLAESTMGNTTSSQQDSIDLSCLPDEFIDGLRSVAEVKQHMLNGRQAKQISISYSLMRASAVYHMLRRVFIPLVRNRYEVGERGELPEAPPNKVTVFIDVDETLVYVTPIPLLKVPADRTFAFSEPPGEDKDIRSFTATPLPPLTLEEAATAAQNFDPNAPQAILYVYYRPFVKRLLMELRGSGKFEIIAFTAALPEYANPILDTLEDEEKLFDHRLYRRHCCRAPRTRTPQSELANGGEPLWSFSGEVYYYVKDLVHAAPNRDLRRCVLLDNSPVSFAAQMENGIYLRPFCGDPGDDELQFLSNMLCQLHSVEDVRGGLHTGLINAAWRSLVERDELYEIAGFPRPSAAEPAELEDLLTDSPAAKLSKMRDAAEAAMGMAQDVSESTSQRVSGEFTWNEDSPNSFEECQEKEQEDIIEAVAASREPNGHQFDERAFRTGSSLSLWHASSSDASMSAGSKDPLVTPVKGRRSASHVSISVPRASRRPTGKQAVPTSSAEPPKPSCQGGHVPSRGRGPRTPRSSGVPDEKDASRYKSCYEAGRARKEAADTRSAANSCRSGRQSYHGDSRSSLANSSDGLLGARTADDGGHTISCLKRQERDATTWCTCANTKTSDARLMRRDNSRRRVGGSATALDSNEGLSRRACDRRLLHRRGRESSADEASDLTSESSPSYRALPSRTPRESRVPKLQLQGLTNRGRERNADFGLEVGVGEEPLTPGKQPLTPSSRKARLANIEQILEDSLTLSRQQCPEPMAQSRNRLKQPATMYGCPDVQAPNLLCALQQQSPFGSNSQGRPRVRPPIAPPSRRSHGEASLGGLTESQASLQPTASRGNLTPPRPPSSFPQHPEYACMQEAQQQRLPSCAARAQEPPFVHLGAMPQRWPSTPRFADVREANEGPGELLERNPLAAYGTPRVSGPPNGVVNGFNASPRFPQMPYGTSPRCATPTEEYASIRQQVAHQRNPWKAASGPPSSYAPGTPRTAASQTYFHPSATPTPSHPSQISPTPSTARQAARQQQPSKLFAGRRMRLGEMFGGSPEGSQPQASPRHFQNNPFSQDHLIRPAVLVKTEESANFVKPSSQQQQTPMSRTPSLPLIMPYVAEMPPTSQGYPMMQSSGPSSFAPSPRKVGGGISRGSLPPMMHGAGGGPTSPANYPYPMHQSVMPHFGFPFWPWNQQAAASPLTASMSVIPRLP
ncbi:hypothetical protein Efla_001751 [Eimeria flavescens]